MEDKVQVLRRVGQEHGRAVRKQMIPCEHHHHRGDRTEERDNEQETEDRILQFPDSPFDPLVHQRHKADHRSDDEKCRFMKRDQLQCDSPPAPRRA